MHVCLNSEKLFCIIAWHLLLDQVSRTIMQMLQYRAKQANVIFYVQIVGGGLEDFAAWSSLKQCFFHSSTILGFKDHLCDEA